MFTVFKAALFKLWDVDEIGWGGGGNTTPFPKNIITLCKL